MRARLLVSEEIAVERENRLNLRAPLAAVLATDAARAVVNRVLDNAGPWLFLGKGAPTVGRTGDDRVRSTGVPVLRLSLACRPVPPCPQRLDGPGARTDSRRAADVFAGAQRQGRRHSRAGRPVGGGRRCG